MHRTSYPLADPRRAANRPPPRTPPPSDSGASVAASLPADHHLWRNGRLWWIAITLHDAQGRRRRVRRSLGTDDVADARWQRDRFLDRVRRAGSWTLADPALRRGAARDEVAA
jgi:hypothetical protein